MSALTHDRVERILLRGGIDGKRLWSGRGDGMSEKSADPRIAFQFCGLKDYKKRKTIAEKTIGTKYPTLATETKAWRGWGTQIFLFYGREA
jgi:hypothetical protein